MRQVPLLSPKACVFEDCHPLHRGAALSTAAPEMQTVEAMTKFVLKSDLVERGNLFPGGGAAVEVPVTRRPCLRPLGHCGGVPGDGRTASLLCDISHLLGLKSDYESRVLEREKGSEASRNRLCGQLQQDVRLHGDQGRLRKPQRQPSRAHYQRRHKLPSIRAKDKDVPNFPWASVLIHSRAVAEVRLCLQERM